MSVVSCKEYSTQYAEADDGTVTYSVVWQVVTDAITDGVSTVKNASGLPKRGDSYSFGGDSDQNAICTSRQISNPDVKGTRKQWHISLSYSSKGNKSDPQDQSGGTGDPVDWSWRVVLNTWHKMIAPDKDRNGRAFVNVCGEPFLPPPEKEQQYPLIVLEKNDRWMNLTAWAAAIGRVNSDAGRWGLGARCIKLRSWSVQPHWIGPNSMYWSHRMECEINSSGFYYQPPNLGMNFIDGFDAAGNPNVRVILDDRSIPISRPQKLDQFGGRIPAGGAAVFFDQAGGVLQQFEIEDQYDFTGILPAQLPGNFQNAS